MWNEAFISDVNKTQTRVLVEFIKITYFRIKQLMNQSICFIDISVVFEFVKVSQSNLMSAQNGLVLDWCTRCFTGCNIFCNSRARDEREKCILRGDKFNQFFLQVSGESINNKIHSEWIGAKFFCNLTRLAVAAVLMDLQAFKLNFFDTRRWTTNIIIKYIRVT